ncbi:signal transduction protein [Phyllobacterium salinisoli]|uniref:Signal transduction protein n=2 Tax=Phyllobacterium salinisoli TaxID=1899321 RepID=A0A368K119_9HYPH|nr:signal transduction protein [Phyllobacterium salinisoli]
MVAALFLSAPSAQAQASPILQRLDANSDGAISREEILATRAKLFARLDLNGDGAIGEDEKERLRDAIMDRAMAMQARFANQMQRLDTSGDGRVSEDEFRARTFFFDLADRDGDGKLSAAEFLVIRNIMFNR